jgi:hypothetical protein
MDDIALARGVSGVSPDHYPHFSPHRPCVGGRVTEWLLKGNKRGFWPPPTPRRWSPRLFLAGEVVAPPTQGRWRRVDVSV